MDALEKLRSRNRFEETLPSGLQVTVRLPRIRDCILAGHVPLPMLTKLVEQATQNGSGMAVTTEEAEHMARFQDEIVRRSRHHVELSGGVLAAECAAQIAAARTGSAAVD